VYASKEQRVGGGGSLDLPAVVAEELGLEEESITGTWDYAHNLQIVWQRALAQHPVVEDLINSMFAIMDDFRVGKASTMFRVKAVELGHLILSNKKKQVTRFVAAMMKGAQAYLRNLPTLVVVLAEMYEEAALEGRNKDARETLGKLNNLRDSRKLLLLVGLVQMLEKYTEASIQSQHSKRFPTQTWSTITEMREKVRALGRKWEWGEEPLKFAGIEAPVKVKERLEREGVYRPKVTEAQVRGSKVRAETNLVTEGSSIKELFDDEGESVIPLAGQASMEVPLAWRARRGQEVEEGRGGGGGGHLTKDDVLSVEKELQEMANDIVEEWDKRQKQTNLEKATYTSFAETFNWGEDRIKVEAEGARAVVNLRHTRKMRELLANIITLLPEVQAQYFDVDLMLEGYSCYMKYRSKEIASMLAGGHVRADMRDDIIYEAWYKVSLQFL
jgi:hypothetical protein